MARLVLCERGERSERARSWRALAAEEMKREVGGRLLGEVAHSDIQLEKCTLGVLQLCWFSFMFSLCLSCLLLLCLPGCSPGPTPFSFSLGELISPCRLNHSAYLGDCPDFCSCRVFCSQLACWLCPLRYPALASNSDY